MINARSILAGCMMVLAMSQLVSCTGLQTAANKNLYALDAGSPAAAHNSAPAQEASATIGSIPRDQILQIRRVSIAPPFDGSSFIYRTPAGTYVKDYYNEWVAPPQDLFSGQLVDWLSASRIFASVVGGQSAAPHRFALETNITALYGDFHDPHHPQVVLAARVFMLDDSGATRTVAFQNHYDISLAIPDASAQQFVVGAGKAYRQLLESVSRDLLTFRETAVAANGE